MAQFVEISSGIFINNDCFLRNNIQLMERIGSGNFSVVHRVCYLGNCNYALKIIFLPIDFGNDFETEVEITSKMSQLGVGVPYITSWKCRAESGNELGMILFEKWDSVGGYISSTAFNVLLTKVQTMHNAGYVHGDPSPFNMLVKINSAGKYIEDIRIIDFGLSFNYKEPLDKINLEDRLIHLNATRKIKLVATTPEEYIQAIYLCDQIGWI